MLQEIIKAMKRIHPPIELAKSENTSKVEYICNVSINFSEEWQFDDVRNLATLGTFNVR